MDPQPGGLTETTPTSPLGQVFIPFFHFISWPSRPTLQRALSDNLQRDSRSLGMHRTCPNLFALLMFGATSEVWILGPSTLHLVSMLSANWLFGFILSSLHWSTVLSFMLLIWSFWIPTGNHGCLHWSFCTVAKVISELIYQTLLKPSFSLKPMDS